MIKKVTTLALSIFLLTLVTPILAEETGTATSSPTTTKREGVKEIIKETVQKRVEVRKELTQGKLEERREKIASKTATLRERLQAFKDKTKATLTEKINSNLNRINLQKTDQMSKHLDRMSEILAKLENRVNNLAEEGKDATQAHAAITEAKEAIEAANIAVDTQAEKDYTLTVSSEATVRADAKKMRDSLHTDLKATHETVRTAKMSVASAIETASTTLGGNN